MYTHAFIHVNKHKAHRNRHTCRHVHSYMYINRNILHMHPYTQTHAYTQTHHIHTYKHNSGLFVFFTFNCYLFRISGLCVYNSTSSSFLMTLCHSLKSYMYVSGLLSKRMLVKTKFKENSFAPQSDREMVQEAL